MAERSSFFNSVSGDRKYSAEDWAAYFSAFIGNGVYGNPSNGLQVVVSTGMGITIKTGSGFINGYFYRNTTDMAKTIAYADGIYARIDRVVMRWSLIDRNITVNILEGTPASNPVAPSLTQDVETFELALADIYVGQGVTGLVQSNITDLRADSTLCGIVTGVIDQFDFSTLTAQFNAFFAEYRALIEETFDTYDQRGAQRYNTFDTDMTDFESEAEADFAEWFANLEYVLDGDVAGHLQNEIDDLETSVGTVDTKTISTYVHAKSGTAHSLTLTGGSNNIRFVATAGYTKGDTFTVNGTAVSVLLPNGKVPGTKFFVTGSTVFCLLSGTTLYLVGGGGGGGEQYLVSLPVADWYAQTPDANYDFWYACPVTLSDFDSTEQDVAVSAANAATYDWLAAHGYYELEISMTGFTVLADEIPDFALQIFYELKTRGENA